MYGMYVLQWELRLFPQKNVHTKAKMFMHVLKVMSSKQLSFDADALQDVLKNNIQLKEGLEMKEHETAKRSKQIVEYVKYFVKLRLIKSIIKQEKEVMNVLVETCTYNHSNSDDHNSIRKIFEFPTGTCYRNIIEQNTGMNMTS